MGPAVGEYSWDADFPADCPPPDAVAAEGDFYRLVKNDPPTLDDFRQPRRLGNRQFPKGQECEACAVSVFADLEEAKQLRLFAPGFRKRKIAKGKLVAEMGVVKNTPYSIPDPPTVFKTHHDWWIPMTYTACPPFILVTL